MNKMSRRRAAAHHGLRHDPSPEEDAALLLALAGSFAGALEAELAGSTIAAGWGEGDAARAVAVLAAQTDVAALAALRALAAVLDDDGGRAARAADGLAAAGVPEPAWRAALERTRVTAAVRCREGARDGVFAEFEQGAEAHVLGAFVDPGGAQLLLCEPGLVGLA